MNAKVKNVYVECGEKIIDAYKIYEYLLGKPNFIERKGVEVTLNENPRFISWDAFGLMNDRNEDIYMENCKIYTEFHVEKAEDVDECFVALTQYGCSVEMKPSTIVDGDPYFYRCCVLIGICGEKIEVVFEN